MNWANHLAAIVDSFAERMATCSVDGISTQESVRTAAIEMIGELVRRFGIHAETFKQQAEGPP